MELQPKHQDSVIGKLLNLKKQIEYHRKHIQPRFGELELWEKKEYHAVHLQNMMRFGYYKDFIKAEANIFNELLNEYGHTVDSFIEKVLGCVDSDWPMPLSKIS